MRFEWPELLWLLGLLPMLLAVYARALRRRRRTPVVPLAGARAVRSGWTDAARRTAPPLLLILGAAALLVGAARPSAVVLLPSMNELVILAIDASGSMRARDVEPDRITVAQAAARAFVAAQPASTRIGVVSFAASASVLQPPTHDRQAVFAALDRIEIQQATAIGSGLLVSLKAIFPDMRLDLRDAPAGPRGDAARRGGGAPRSGAGSGDSGSSNAGSDAAAKQVDPGSMRSAAIVLLSDGESSTGPDPIEAARQAAQRGVRVYTVGFGTPAGVTLKAEGWAMRVRLDEATLRKIADVTLGEYFQAASAADLKKVYGALSAKLSFERSQLEVSALFAAAGAALALLGGGLSLLWFGRIL